MWSGITLSLSHRNSASLLGKITWKIDNAYIEESGRDRECRVRFVSKAY